MTRLLLNGEWFDQIAPSALYETEYEKVVLQQAPMLYPDYFMVPFKATVYSDSAAAKPDAVLIERTYREWWVVEIEMAHHSFRSHVLPQVSTLANGYYDENHAEHICQQMPSLDPNKVKDILKGKPPQLLIIVNSPVSDWVQPLRSHNAVVAVFEIFRSGKNRHIFRVNGENPVAPAEVISECHFDRSLPGLLVVESPAALGVSRSEALQIMYMGYVTEWTRIDAQERVWLAPVRANPLPGDKEYELLSQEDGELFIRPRTTLKR